VLSKIKKDGKIGGMRIELNEASTAQLVRLAKAADLSRAQWIRAALNAADHDPALAATITAAAPKSQHGGYRPGAGRPRKRRGDDNGTARHVQEVEAGG